MSQNYNLSAIAGEYVLGTLDSRERAFVEKERRQNQQLHHEIVFWEESLFPLLSGVSPIEPSLQLWNKLDQLITPPVPHNLPPKVIIAPVALPLPSKPAPILIAPVSQPQPVSGFDQKINYWQWKMFAVAASVLALGAVYYSIRLAQIAHYPLSPLALFQSDFRLSPIHVRMDTGQHMLKISMGHMPQLSSDKIYKLWLVIGDIPVRHAVGLLTGGLNTMPFDTTGFDETGSRQVSYEVREESIDNSASSLPSGHIVAFGHVTRE